MAKGDRVPIGQAIKHAQKIPVNRGGTPVGKRRIQGRALSAKLMQERMEAAIEERVKERLASAAEGVIAENAALKEKVAAVTKQVADLTVELDTVKKAARTEVDRLEAELKAAKEPAPAPEGGAAS